MASVLPRMLLVEDRQPLRLALTGKFTDLGVEVIAIEDGGQASDVLSAESFDVILLDLMLPTKDGMTILRELRAANDPTPVIVFTNDATSSLQVKAMAAGAQDFFIKSDTSVETIVGTVAKYIPSVKRDQTPS